MSQSEEPVPESKWVKGVSRQHPIHKAARRILQSRLSAVSYWLSRAAEKSDEDVEYVHQLRVSARRALAVVRAFSDLIPKSACEDLRVRLHQLRRVADEARNLDVLCAEFVCCADTSCEDTCAQVAEAIRQRRREAQQPIAAIHEELAAGDFNGQIAEVLKEFKKKGKGKAKPVFGKQAPRYLKPVVKKFFLASEADLANDEAFHEFRLRGKKLRYTMEIVAPAFGPEFRRKLYRQISVLLDVMGMVNDRATAKVFFGDWIEKTEDAKIKAFFRGILLAETKAHNDLRQAFDAIWTPKAAKELKQQFRACCGFC